MNSRACRASSPLARFMIFASTGSGVTRLTHLYMWLVAISEITLVARVADGVTPGG